MSKRVADNTLTSDNWDAEEECAEVGHFKQASPSQLKDRAIRKAKRRRDPNATNAPVFTNFTGFGDNKKGSESPMFSFGGAAPKAAVSEFSFGIKKIEDASAVKVEVSSKENQSPKCSTTGSIAAPTSLKMSSLLPESISQAKSSLKFGPSPTPSMTPAQSFAFSSPPSTTPSNAYLRKLKSLNVKVLEWITKHVNGNPYVNLAPVFDDYTKHFTELKNHKEKKTNTTGTQKSLIPCSAPTPPTPKTYESAKPSGFSFGTNSTASTVTPFTFGNPSEKQASSNLFAFGSNSNSSSSQGFSFGAQTTTTSILGTTPTISKPSEFSFGFANKPAPKPEVKSTEDEEDQPPKVEVNEVKEEGATYEKKVKLFYKKEDNYVEKGVGMLFLKPAGDKTQLIVRAMTNLGNILLNIVLNSSIPSQRMGKNNVMIMCVPNPPIDPKEPSSKPASMLIRVKTSEDADELLQKLEDSKK